MNKLRISIGILGTISMCVYAAIAYLVIWMGNSWTNSSKPFTLVEWCIIIIPSLYYLFQVVMVIKPLPIQTLSHLQRITLPMILLWLLVVFLFFTIFTPVLIFMGISPLLFEKFVDRLKAEQQPTDPA